MSWPEVVNNIAQITAITILIIFWLHGKGK